MSTSRRSYRELQADASVEVDAAIRQATGEHCCPHCGHRWTGSTAPPARDSSAERARAAALRDSGRVFAEILRSRQVDEQVFDVWLSQLQLVDGTATTVDLAAPRETAQWIRERFSDGLDRAASHLAGTGMRARILTGTVPDVPTLGDLLSGSPAARRPADEPPSTVTTDPEGTT